MAYGMMRRGGPDMIVVNRTREKADDTARFLGQYGPAEARDWSALPAAIAEADVIVNASTLGMKGAPAFDWPLGAAKLDAIVFDAVYARGGTDLVRKARAQGLRTVDGLAMLVHQGAIAFDIWFGVKPDTMMARERLDAILAARP
jgi:shikimate dehydrogenase